MSTMMNGLQKMISKAISKKGLHVLEEKENRSFKCYQKMCQLLKEDGSPDTVFVLYF